MLMNRKERRRANAIARRSVTALQKQLSFGANPTTGVRNLRATLISTAAAGALAFAPTSAVRAQTVVPPSNGPCVVVGTTATCTGDVSAGVDANAPLTTLNVNNLNQNIAPAAGVDGINFEAVGDITINSNTSPFVITTTGNNAEGISGYVAGNGSVTISSTGDITTAGDGAEGVSGFVLGDGNVDTTSTGNITTTGNVQVSRMRR